MVTPQGPWTILSITAEAILYATFNKEPGFKFLEII